jgi:amidase
MDEIIYESATSIARAIREKELSSEEVVRAYVARIEEVNPKLNAIVQPLGDRALEQARQMDSSLARGELKGPLHGVPITIKDAFEMAGIVSAGGTKGRAAFVPQADATAVTRLKAAGAVILGKTNVPEVSLAYESDNLVYGQTKNPYDVSRTPGGSSGGEAAAIAAGMSSLGLGSDTGGSIRLPAHFCGIAGIKPTSGRTPRTGHFPPMGGAVDPLFQIGPLARFVDDLTLALPIICGPDWRDPTVAPVPLGDPAAVDIHRLRVAFHTDNGILAASPEIAATVGEAAKALANAGVTIVEERPPGIEQAYDLLLGLFCADGGASLRMLLAMVGTTETHLLMTRLLEILSQHPLTTAEFEGLLFSVDMYRSAMLAFMEDYDAILCPPCARVAMPHGSTFQDENQLAFSYTMTYNLTGWPGAVVRAGTSSEGLPIGVQVVGRPWREDVALALARVVESSLGGWQRPAI